MPTPDLTPDLPRPVLEGGRLTIAVPWDLADQVQWGLRRKGFPTTLSLNPETRVARLEVWPGVPTEAVLLALEDIWPGRKPSRTGDAPSPGRAKEAGPAAPTVTPAALST